MRKRSLISVWTAAAVLTSLPLVYTQVFGQGRLGSGGRGGGGLGRASGPVPRTLDGHPDFTGVFDVDGIEDIRDVLVPGSEIRHTPYGAERYKQADYAQDPNSKCLPWGPTRMMCCTRHAIGFVMNPQVIVIITESQQTFRLAYMDGRPLPKDLYDREGHVDRQVGGWMGFSRGRWEADTLVVDTVGADDRTWVDGHGAHQHSEKMKLTERLRMIDANTIEYGATIDDPVIYQKPWAFNKTFKRMTGGGDADRILSQSCVENEKDVEYQKPTYPPDSGEGGPTVASGRGAGRGRGN